MDEALKNIYEYLNNINKQFDNKLLDSEILQDFLETINNFPQSVKKLSEISQKLASYETFPKKWEEWEAGGRAKEGSDYHKYITENHELQRFLSETQEVFDELSFTVFPILGHNYSAAVDVPDDPDELPYGIQSNSNALKDFLFQKIKDFVCEEIDFLHFSYWFLRVFRGYYNPFDYIFLPDMSEFTAKEFQLIMEIDSMLIRQMPDCEPEDIDDDDKELIEKDFFFNKDDILRRVREIYQELEGNHNREEKLAPEDIEEFKKWKKQRDERRQLDENTFGF